MTRSPRLPRAAPEPGHGRPVWQAAAAVACPPLAAAAEADLAVVGGGLVGLCVAIAAARAGARTVLLEAGRLGHGASGRTSGFVAPALRPLPGGQSLDAVLGEGRAAAFRALSAGSGAAVFGLIAAAPVPVPVDSAGWIAAAHSPAAMARLAAQARPGDAVLDAGALAALTGIAGWHGGVLHADSGAVEPAAYVQALAALAAAAGAALHEASPAALVGGPEDRALVANGHRLRARHVVIAANALGAAIAPAVGRAVLPVSAWQAVTVPLPAAVRARLLPGGHAVTDTRRNSVALRWTPDGRLLTGGGIGATVRGDASAAARRYGRRLKAIAGPAARAAGLSPDALHPAQVWSGRIALTRSGLPELFCLDPGVTAVIACNGRGIALGTAVGLALGTALAQGLAGPRGAVAEALAGLPLPLHPPLPHPLHRLAGPGARLRMPWADLMDWREAGRTPVVAAHWKGGRA